MMKKGTPASHPANARLTQDKRWSYAFSLAIFTIVFNIAEGLVSIFFGLKDEALTLFGFGLDSFVETVSASGVAVMITRIRRSPDSERSRFEVTALKITGWCFYALSVILSAGAVINLVRGSHPETTVPGMIIALVSIASMLGLIYAKKYLGRKLASPPLIADANCNLVCVYMSLVLLAASAAFEIFRLGFIDTIGTAGIIYFSIKEGQESFEKARGIHACSCHEESKNCG
jgi:divalent metal cation (Fe/Co/Zn/Cd) transporter